VYGLYNPGWAGLPGEPGEPPFMEGGLDLEIFALVGGIYVSAGVVTVSPYFTTTSGVQSFDQTFSVRINSAIGEVSGDEFKIVSGGFSIGTAAENTITGLPSVSWQVENGSVTETAVSNAVRVTVSPRS
jgi:hypothetical protein